MHELVTISRSFPSVSALIIRFFCLDPGALTPIGRMFALPERCIGLEKVHDEAGRIECRLPMRGAYRNHDDVFTGSDQAETMYNGHAEHWPTRDGTFGDAPKRGFSHGRIMFKLQG